jgi:CubicO group peptidase (beta-lactamase class C family)
MNAVTPMPRQPPDTPWPTVEWPVGSIDDLAGVDAAAVRAALAEIRDTPPELGVTVATLVIHRGRLVAEQYGDGPDGPVDAATTLISWSMAKSITQTLFGVLIADGLLDRDAIDEPAPVPEFAGTDKAAITIAQLLAMRSGLEFVEDYVDDAVSHCLEMLFGAGASDHAHYAASLPLQHPPGEVWNYSSGTSNILARIAGDVIRGNIRERLFERIGMTTAEPKFDAAGNFVGSSYVYATARDFARFGYLYLRDGVWDGDRVVPEGWVDEARTVRSIDPDPPHYGYGDHWWIWRDQPGSVAAHGYEGQYVVVVPERELVVVHLGKVPSNVRAPLLHKLTAIINAFPETSNE